MRICPMILKIEPQPQCQQACFNYVSKHRFQSCFHVRLPLVVPPPAKSQTFGQRTRTTCYALFWRISVEIRISHALVMIVVMMVQAKTKLPFLLRRCLSKVLRFETAIATQNDGELETLNMFSVQIEFKKSHAEFCGICIDSGARMIAKGNIRDEVNLCQVDYRTYLNSMISCNNKRPWFGNN